MPGPVKKPVKEYRPGGVAEFPNKAAGDVVQRKDKDQAVAEANAPRTPRVAIIKEVPATNPDGTPHLRAHPGAYLATGKVTVPTMVVTKPAAVPQKDALGMMSSKPVDMRPDAVALTAPGGDPNALARAAAVNEGKERQAAALGAPDPWYAKPADTVSTAMFGPIGNEALQRALEAVRKRKAGK